MELLFGVSLELQEAQQNLNIKINSIFSAGTK